MDNGYTIWRRHIFYQYEHQIRKHQATPGKPGEITRVAFLGLLELKISLIMINRSL